MSVSAQTWKSFHAIFSQLREACEIKSAMKKPPPPAYYFFLSKALVVLETQLVYTELTTCFQQLQSYLKVASVKIAMQCSHYNYTEEINALGAICKGGKKV